MQQLHHTLYSEVELVVFIKEKDQRAFAYLYNAYSPCLYGVIQNIIGDDHMAEDALQDVFLRVWSRIDQFDPQKGRLFTWMINIARNAAKDVLRTKAEKMRLNTTADDTLHYMQADTRHHTDAIGLKTLITRLRPECQVILDMVYYKGYTILDVAKTLAIPEGTIKTRLREALRNLRTDFHHTTTQYAQLLPHTTYSQQQPTMARV